jgi:hypothetical protein
MSLGAGASTIPAPAPPAVSFFLSEGIDLSTRINPSSFVSRLKFGMLASRSPVLWFSCRPCYRFQFPVVAGVFFSVLRYSWRSSFRRPSSQDFLYHIGPGPSLPRFTIPLGLKIPEEVPFCHATFARRNTFLQAAANFLLNSQYPWVLSLIFWRRSAARFRTLRRFLGSPTGITAASCWCFVTDSISSGFAFKS